MMSAVATPEIRMVPIDLIELLNPRERNDRIFQSIVNSIQAVGLKKPVTVTPRFAPGRPEKYLLVCGEGRLKAFRSLGQQVIPALVVAVSDEDALLMGLAENIARRPSRPFELLAGIERLQTSGYSKKEISEKTGLSEEYVRSILHLLQQGEERLLAAVEQGRLSLSVALKIAAAGEDHLAVQTALHAAYEAGELRGKQLTVARHIATRRKHGGRALTRGGAHKQEYEKRPVSPTSIIRSYQTEVERQRRMVKKSDFAHQRLVFIVAALRQLLADENFYNLLRAEQLDTMPGYLADRVFSQGDADG